MNNALIREAKEHVKHEIAPSLLPTVRGNYQARLIGLHRSHAQVEVNLVNAKKEVVKRFGSNVVPQGGAVIIDKHSSLWNIAPNAPPVPAYFQAWVVGISHDHTEAEISLRLVDDNRKELVNFGSATIKVGKTMTVEGLEVAVRVLPKDMH